LDFKNFIIFGLYLQFLQDSILPRVKTAKRRKMSLVTLPIVESYFANIHEKEAFQHALLPRNNEPVPVSDRNPFP
jgi:hypothetical protein